MFIPLIGGAVLESCEKAGMEFGGEGTDDKDGVVENSGGGGDGSASTIT